MASNDFEIELQDDLAARCSDVQLPVNFLRIGEIETDDVKIYIHQKVYKALEKFSSSNTAKELGSIMLGEYTQSMGKTHVIITDYIEAKYTDASASTLTFTHESWDYIHKEHSNNYSDKKIIGWQHTHPNYGIFLSNYDMFIQENFFNLPFQIAYVIDPIQNIRGFFQWKNGKVEKLKGYYIYDDVGKPIKIEQSPQNDKRSQVNKNASKTSIILSVVSVILSISLGIMCLSLIEDKQNLENSYKKLSNELALQQQYIDEQKESITDINNNLVIENNKVNNESTGQSNFENELQNYSERLDIIESEVSNIKNKSDNNSGDFIYLKSYCIEDGDNLISICERHNINYFSNRNIILAINGIINENDIYVGQNILLPVSKQ